MAAADSSLLVSPFYACSRISFIVLVLLNPRQSVPSLSLLTNSQFRVVTSILTSGIFSNSGATNRLTVSHRGSSLTFVQRIHQNDSHLCDLSLSFKRLPSSSLGMHEQHKWRLENKSSTYNLRFGCACQTECSPMNRDFIIFSH